MGHILETTFLRTLIHSPVCTVGPLIWNHDLNPCNGDFVVKPFFDFRRGPFRVCGFELTEELIVNLMKWLNSKNCFLVMDDSIGWVCPALIDCLIGCIRCD